MKERRVKQVMLRAGNEQILKTMKERRVKQVMLRAG
jgi:hypothetical protein